MTLTLTFILKLTILDFDATGGICVSEHIFMILSFKKWKNDKPWYIV